MKKIVPIYPWPMHPKIAELMATFPDIMPVEAVVGGPDPILAIRQAPDFVCDSIVVKTPDKVAQAIDIVIGDGIELITVRDQMTSWIGLDKGKPMKETIERTGRKGPTWI
jgi:hypothetical protein